MATSIPVVVTSAGVQPTPPATLRAALVAAAALNNPGYTANLPASLIEDWASTGTGALTISDSARVEVLNSISPYTANDFLLAQLGQIYIGPGAAPGVPTNTSVLVVFTAIDTATGLPAPGQTISLGFTITDGTYQYVVQDGGVTATDGMTQPLFCLATIAGQWAVASSSVSHLVTAEPPGITLSCTNPLPGISGAVAETTEQYRARVVQAGQAIAMGTTQLAKTLLGKVPNVQQRLISVVEQPGLGWTIIVGGGDPYLTAGAIVASGIDISGLFGATLAIVGITNANPAVIETATNHNYTTGNSTEVNAVLGMTQINGESGTVTVIDEKSFSINIDTTSFAPYAGGGVLTPNPINLTTDVADYPNTYGVITVTPPAEPVTMVIGYDTTLSNFASQAAVAQAVAPAVAAYINTIPGGQPISLIAIESIFADEWNGLGFDTGLISSLTIAVSINGVGTAPVGKLVFGDPWSYLTATTAAVVVQQT